jgi:hypothetical protein
MAGRIELLCNLHVHTTFSDGSGTIEQVIAAAQRAGLDVLLINDHDTLAAKDKGIEGYHDHVLVLIGFEYSGPHNHYLVYGLDRCPDYDWRRPQDFIDQVKAMGGVGFLAHPFEQGSPLSEGGQAFTWIDWSVNGFDGLCLWNYMSMWKTKARDYPSAIYHYIFRSQTLGGPDDEVLAKWDELGQNRRVAGIAGTDAHAFKVKLAGPLCMQIFPYEYLFRAFNTHLLVHEPLAGNPEADKETIIQALAGGSCFLAHDRLHPGRGFSFRMENGTSHRADQGQEVRHQNGDFLIWRLPHRTKSKLVKDGRTVLELTAAEGRLAVDTPGVYRVEAYWRTRFFGYRPWIFSNPIYVRT